MKTIASALMICLLILRANPASAEIKIAEMIFSAIVHGLGSHGIKSLFNENSGVTSAQLGEALDSNLRSYRVEAIKDRVSALNNQLATYSSDLSPMSRKLAVADIIQRTSDLEPMIYTNVVKGEFWQLLPGYLNVINIRLAFLMERSLIEPKGYDAKTILAREALNGLSTVREMFENDFVDLTDFNCVHKYNNHAFWNWEGRDIKPKWTHGGKMACKSDHKWIVNHSLGAVSAHTPNSEIWNKRRLFKRPGHSGYYFVFKWHPKNQYLLIGGFDEATAKQLRVKLAVKNYPKKLGDVETSLSGWWKIVTKMGTDKQKAGGKLDVQHLLRQPGDRF